MPLRGLALLGLTLVLAGCGEPQGVVFEPPETPMRWPAAPAPARIEWVGQLASDRDLKPGRSFAAVVLGDESEQSMLSPYAVCTDGGERVFVSDSNAHVVHVFDLDTRDYARWPAGKAEPFAQPLGLAWDPAGDPAGVLLVADGPAGEVVVLDGQGRVRQTMGGAVLRRPTGIAVDAARGRRYVVDAAAHQVVVFDADGRLVRRLGERGTAPGQFNYPTNAAVDAGGRLYVADSLNFRVQVFDAELEPVRQIGTQGDRPGYFSQPKGLAIDGEGHLYVVDAHFESVQIFDDAGRLLLAFGSEGHGPGEFWLPAGIHVDSSERIWIADSYNRRVQVFQYLGAAE